MHIEFKSFKKFKNKCFGLNCIPPPPISYVKDLTLTTM